MRTVLSLEQSFQAYQLLVLQWQGRTTLPLWFCQASIDNFFFKDMTTDCSLPTRHACELKYIMECLCCYLDKGANNCRVSQTL